MCPGAECKVWAKAEGILICISKTKEKTKKKKNNIDDLQTLIII